MNGHAKPGLLIFTDLDGTLLDHDTYDFSLKLPALAALQAAQVPLILCSSKTHAELQYWSGRLHIDYPLFPKMVALSPFPQTILRDRSIFTKSATAIA